MQEQIRTQETEFGELIGKDLDQGFKTQLTRRQMILAMFGATAALVASQAKVLPRPTSPGMGSVQPPIVDLAGKSDPSTTPEQEAYDRRVEFSREEFKLEDPILYSAPSDESNFGFTIPKEIRDLKFVNSTMYPGEQWYLIEFFDEEKQLQRHGYVQLTDFKDEEKIEKLAKSRGMHEIEDTEYPSKLHNELPNFYYRRTMELLDGTPFTYHVRSDRILPIKQFLLIELEIKLAQTVLQKFADLPNPFPNGYFLHFSHNKDENLKYDDGTVYYGYSYFNNSINWDTGIYDKAEEAFGSTSDVPINIIDAEIPFGEFSIPHELIHNFIAYNPTKSDQNIDLRILPDGMDMLMYSMFNDIPYNELGLYEYEFNHQDGDFTADGTAELNKLLTEEEYEAIRKRLHLVIGMKRIISGEESNPVTKLWRGLKSRITPRQAVIPVVLKPDNKKYGRVAA